MQRIPEKTIDTAWNLIGHEGPVRIVGGRTVYEAVIYYDNERGKRVKLARLEAGAQGLRQINRYVDPNTKLEVLGD